MTSPSDKPLISVVIIAYNMAREIPRTVLSFLPPYQTDIASDEIEIIVMENGSSRPVDPAIVRSWPDNVRYMQVQDPKPSPAQALNVGVAAARGTWVCPVIDGARMVSGGVLKSAKAMMAVYNNPVIATFGYHLGDRIQAENVHRGYNQTCEDYLLGSVGWPSDPSRLFDISCAGGSALHGWFKPLPESNVLFMTKAFYRYIGGYDEQFDIPGGGLVNLDFFRRVVDHPESQYVLLLGEGSFHQYHGGVTTSRSVTEPDIEDDSRTTWEVYADQYREIRGVDYAPPVKAPILFGPADERVKRSTLKAALLNQNEAFSV